MAGVPAQVLLVVIPTVGGAVCPCARLDAPQAGAAFLWDGLAQGQGVVQVGFGDLVSIVHEVSHG